MKAAKSALARAGFFEPRLDMGRDLSRAVDYHCDFQKTMRESHGIHSEGARAFSLTPLVMRNSEFALLQTDIIEIVAAVRAISQRVFEGDVDAHMQYLHLSELERTFVLAGVCGNAITIARPDCIISESGIEIVELNIGSGIGYLPESHLGAQYYNGSPLLRTGEGVFRQPVTAMDPLKPFLGMLGRANGSVEYLRSENPDVLPSDRRVYDLWMDRLKEGGLQVCNALSCKCGGSSCKPAATFLGFSTYQLERRFHTLDGATRKRVMSAGEFLFSPPGTVLLENKLNLALLSDPHYAHHFSPTQRAAIARRIPWTRKLDCSISPSLLDRKDDWVIKRAGGRGGDAVFLGRHMSREGAKALIARAGRDGDWIVQSYRKSCIANTLHVGPALEPEWRASHFVLRPVILGDAITALFCTLTPLNGSGLTVSGFSSMCLTE